MDESEVKLMFPKSVDLIRLTNDALPGIDIDYESFQRARSALLLLIPFGGICLNWARRAISELVELCSQIPRDNEKVERECEKVLKSALEGHRLATTSS